MLLSWGNLFKCHEEVLYLQPLIPPKRFDIFPPDWGMLRRSRCVLIFLNNNVVTYDQQYNIGEKPTVILYASMNRHARIP